MNRLGVFVGEFGGYESAQEAVAREYRSAGWTTITGLFDGVIQSTTIEHHHTITRDLLPDNTGRSAWYHDSACPCLHRKRIHK